MLIASYLEPEYVARIRAVSPRLNVVYEPELLAPPRYHADHYNLIARTPEQEARWRELLGQADILFDFDPTHRGLPDLAPQLRWLQSSSAGIGQFIRSAGSIGGCRMRSSPPAAASTPARWPISA